MIDKYFQLTGSQKEQFDALPALYRDWNSKINVISRKDIEEIQIHHMLHSLAIAKAEEFKSGMQILDVGTGGGFPGIPLAILFPQAEFTLVDSIGKKVKVVSKIAAELGLGNVKTSHTRAEEVQGSFDFVVSRAVTRLDEFWPWVSGKFKRENRGVHANGLLYLKGGDISTELQALARPSSVYRVADYFTESFFETKLLVYIKA